MSEVLKPYYYATEDTVTATGDNSTLDTALAGVDASVSALSVKLIDQLDDLLSSSGGSKILKFLIKKGVDIGSNIASQSIAITVDSSKEFSEFSVGGVVLDVVGTAAVATAVISLLGPGVILALSAGQFAFTSSLIWSAVKAASELDDDIINLIDNLIDGTVVDIQIVDQNNNVIGGALFKEGLSEEQELEAIQQLLGRTLLIKSPRLPNISIGRDRIRVVDNTSFFPREKEYKVYDGRFVNAISEELGIAKEELLGLGQKNNPNINSQIYYEASTFSPKSFVFVSDEDRFFVPLPTVTYGKSLRILHPSNILISNEDRNVLDAYLANDPSSPFFNQDALLIGTGVSNDTLKGSGGNDVLIGGKGNDEIDGRQGGEDIAIFSDNHKNYDISFSTNGSVTIAHLRGTKTDGTDMLTNVEFAKFKDGILSLKNPLHNKPSQQIGSYIVQQVSADDVIGNTFSIISGSQVYWFTRVGKSAYSNKRTIRFDTNTGLLSGITSDSANTYFLGAADEDKILLGLDYNDRLPHKLELYTGESLVQVGNGLDFDNSTIIYFGDNILFEARSSSRLRQLVAYNYKNGTTTLLAEKNSNSPTLPNFNYGLSSVVKSATGNKIAWAGSIGDDTNDSKIFLYDGNTTIQIPKINEFNGLTYSIPDVSNLQFDGKNLSWTSINPTDGNLIYLFLYNGIETRQIAEVASQTLDNLNGFKLSGNRVVWSTQESINRDTFLNKIYLYDGEGVRSIYESETTTAKTGSSYYTGKIINLTTSGENIVWTERYKKGAVVDDFYLYDIGSSDAQPKLLSKSIDTLLYKFSFQLFGEQVVWTAPNAEAIQIDPSNDGRNQLYAYDGNSVQQLTNLTPNSYDYIDNFGVSGKGVVWVGNDDGKNRDKRDPEIFVATLIQQDSIDNNPDPIPTPTPDPIPTPTPDPIPTPTPDPVPTPTPDPVPTPTPDPVPTPTPDPVPTPTPDPVPTPTPDPVPTPTSKFRVSLVESKSTLVNELAVFTVDDAAGTINGLVPGSEGYAQAALNKARSLFSTIANLPNGFDTSNLTSIIEFDTASSLRFMLVKNSTLDNVKNGITPISDLLFSDLSLQQISNLADSIFPLSWKDSSGNTTDFKDLVIKIEANTDTLPLGTAIQSKSGIELIDLRSDLPPNEIVKAEFSVYREAAFNNYVGFYKINDTDGSITDSFTGNILKPGDVGYIQTAVGNRVAGIDLKVANKSIETLSGEFISGSLFAPFIIINASPTEILDTNTQNDPNVYFAFLGANADRVDHIRLLANNVFGFEDLPNGGDLDYNDMVIAANLMAV